MRFIFSTIDRAEQVKIIRDGISGYRDAGKDNPEKFHMNSVYDSILNQLCDHFLGYWKDKIALLGMGGYGREEMSPYSDIDLLFLRPEDAPEGIYRGIRSILYLLWDARVELGHSVRTIDECRQEADKDLAVLTSLMDVRFVWGDRNIHRSLLIERGALILETNPLDLYLRIEGEIRRSSERFGHTIYLLEPHLKEGPGSLRYIQLLTWLARIIFGCRTLEDLPAAGLCSAKSVEEIDEGARFLSEIRARLHFIEGRRDDRLKFDCQTTISDQMGYRDTELRRGVESFMRDYYRHASTIDFFGRQLLARARIFLRPKLATSIKMLDIGDSFHIGAGGINHRSPESFGDNPTELIVAFTKIAQTGCDFDIRLVDLIRSKLSSVDEKMKSDEQANRLFLKLFQTGGHIATAVNSMMKVGFLEKFIPEFARIRFLPQHDIYHQYTVDLHTIAVLENIQALDSQSGSNDLFLRQIFSKLQNPEVLYLAGLFHDISKGLGPGHEIRGEQASRPILNRLGLPPEETEDVLFLIRNHLAMTHLAFRKDLHDEAMINRFAENVMDRKRLDLLMLLTHADLKAVGPTALNSWKGMLLEELYYRTLDVIEGEGSDGESLSDWIKEIKVVVRDLVPVRYRGPELERFLAKGSARYFLDFYPGIIADHFIDIQNHLMSSPTGCFADDHVIASKIDHRKPGYSSITLIVKDRPGLFFKIAGTLSANRINILSAWTHSIGEVAIATFHVNDIPEGPLDDPDRWEHFKSDFVKVITSVEDVHRLVEARRQSRGVFQPTYSPRFPLKVEIDNSTSDSATIIEVYVHDRPGLLYDITRKMADLKLNLALAKISTEVDQAADIFYVVDINGEKITDFDLLDSIRENLHNHLELIEKTYVQVQDK